MPQSHPQNLGQESPRLQSWKFPRAPSVAERHPSLFLFAAFFLLFSASEGSLYGSASASFLRGTIPASSQALGASVVSQESFAGAALWNPAALAGRPGWFFSFQSSIFPASVKGVSMDLSRTLKFGVLNFYTYQLLVPSIDALDEKGVATGQKLGNAERVFAGAFGRQIGRVRLGLSVEGVLRKLAGTSAGGMGVSGGVQLLDIGKFGFGASMLHVNLLGPGFRDGSNEKMPSELRLGGHWKVLDQGSLTGTLRMDLASRGAEGLYTGGGGEVVFDDTLFFRVGMSSKSKGNFRLGLGVKYWGLAIDYTAELQRIQMMHHFGLTLLRFGGKKEIGK